MSPRAGPSSNSVKICPVKMGAGRGPPRPNRGQQLMARGARRIFFPKRTAPPCEFDGFDGPVKTSAGLALGPYYPPKNGAVLTALMLYVMVPGSREYGCVNISLTKLKEGTRGTRTVLKKGSARALVSRPPRSGPTSTGRW